MEDFESDRCPVCQEKIGKIDIDGRTRESVIEKYKDEIWKPGDPIPEVSTEISDKRKAIEESIREAHERRG